MVYAPYPQARYFCRAFSLTLTMTVDEPEPGAAHRGERRFGRTRSSLRAGVSRFERLRKVVVGCVSDGRIGLSSVKTGTRVAVAEYRGSPNWTPVKLEDRH